MSFSFDSWWLSTSLRFTTLYVSRICWRLEKVKRNSTREKFSGPDFFKKRLSFTETRFACASKSCRRAVAKLELEIKVFLSCWPLARIGRRGHCCGLLCCQCKWSLGKRMLLPRFNFVFRFYRYEGGGLTTSEKRNIIIILVLQVLLVISRSLNHWCGCSVADLDSSLIYFMR